MNKYHKIENVCFKGENLVIVINGQEYSFPISQISERLKNASDIERKKYQVSSSGYGIHWPLIDEDLSINGLLGMKNNP